MPLDVYTLYICEFYVLSFVSIIMVFAWIGAQYDRVLGFTCLGMVLTLLSVFLSSLRSYGFQFLPIFVGNIMVMLAYGLLLNAFRSFCKKPLGYHWAFGAVCWGLLCLIPDFYHSMPLRIVISCLLCIFYTSALIRLLAQARSELKATYWPAQLLLWIHLLFHIARIFLDSGVAATGHGAIGGSTFSVYVILESILFVIGVTFTILAMVNERNQIRYKQASLRDPLTGVWNRRALFNHTDQQLRRRAQRNQPLTVMLFDLDHFKSINDRFGHYQGDRILIDFCQVVSTILPADSHFSRLGGEEFAAVLTIDESSAATLSEHIRTAVAASLPDKVSYSVSIGVTTSHQQDITFTECMIAADKALYRAKANGRNRVEMFSAETAEAVLL